MEVCFLKQKLNGGEKYFLPSWELLICQIWVLQEWHWLQVCNSGFAVVKEKLAVDEQGELR